MISDIKNIDQLLPRYVTDFEEYVPSENKPFTPYQQLLTILPPDSLRRLMPKSYHKFVEKEEFKEFYPLDFEIDMNGKTTPWEAVILIPFVEETLFIEYEKQLLSQNEIHLNEYEQLRNSRGSNVEYTHSDSDEPQPEAHFGSIEIPAKNNCKRILVDYFERYDLVFRADHVNKQVAIEFPSLHYLNI